MNLITIYIISCRWILLLYEISCVPSWSSMLDEWGWRCPITSFEGTIFTRILVPTIRLLIVVFGILMKLFP